MAKATNQGSGAGPAPRSGGRSVYRDRDTHVDSNASLSEGKNRVWQTEHVTTKHYPGGNQGFTSQKALGNSTAQGPIAGGAGAPFHDADRKMLNRTVTHTAHDNPYNTYDQNMPGVVVGKTDFAAPKPTMDSPVPKGATFPIRNQQSKAGEIASAPVMDTPPSSGVLGRG